MLRSYTVYKYITSILFLLVYGISVQAQPIVSKKIKTIVIDAGHGGKDPGAQGKSSREKDVALSIALKTGALIKATHPDIQIIYTRTEDVFVKLIERANIANRAKADLFISIHANSNAKKEVHGTEFWVLGLHKADENLEVAKNENEVVNLEGDVVSNYGFDPNSPEGNIIMTMKQSLYLDKSIQLAKSIEKFYTIEANQINRGTKQAGFMVLYKTSMPSVLIEVGFISNSQEEAYINSIEGQLEISNNIASAFADYRKNYEKSSQDQKASTPFNVNKPAEKIVVPEKAVIEVAPTPRKDVKSVTSYASKPPVETEIIESNETVVTTPKPFRKGLVIEDAESESKERVLSIEEIALNKAPAKIVKPQSTSVKSGISSTVLDNKENKRVIVLEEEMERSLETLQKNISSKAMIPATPKQIAFESKSTPVTSESHRISKPAMSVPTFKKNEDIKKAILENAKELESTYKREEDKNEDKTAIKNPEQPKKQVLKLQILEDEPSFETKVVEAQKAINDRKIETTLKVPELPTKAEAPPVKITTAQPTAVYSPPRAKVPTSIKAVSSQISYKIQVLASPEPIEMSNKIFKTGNNIEESNENGYYKYLVGDYKTMEAAKIKQIELKSSGISGAFIVKYQYGVRIK